jgi:hypothetical protein
MFLRTDPLKYVSNTCLERFVPQKNEIYFIRISWFWRYFLDYKKKQSGMVDFKLNLDGTVPKSVVLNFPELY